MRERERGECVGREGSVRRERGECVRQQGELEVRVCESGKCVRDDIVLVRERNVCVC